MSRAQQLPGLGCIVHGAPNYIVLSPFAFEGSLWKMEGVKVCNGLLIVSVQTSR